MSHDLFSQLAGLIGPGEKLKFEFSRLADGRVNVLLIPVLSSAPEKMSDAAAALRAALSTPLTLTETAPVLDTSFLDVLTSYREPRDEMRRLMDALGEYKDAAKGAVAAAGKAATEKPASSTTDSSRSRDSLPSTPVPAPTDPAGDAANNPDSLF